MNGEVDNITQVCETPRPFLPHHNLLKESILNLLVFLNEARTDPSTTTLENPQSTNRQELLKGEAARALSADREEAAS